MSDLRDMPNIVDETAKMRRELDELQLQVLSSSGGGGGGGGNATWGTISGTLSNQTDLQTALDSKVDKVSGKGLSTNDFTTAEKNKLAGIASGAEVNVQSNWTQTDTTADDYIKNKPTLATVATSGSYADLSNKPTIPTVNNATLTIQKNGTSVGTFTANASSNTTANITVPTKTSEITNDSGFITSSSLPTVGNGTITVNQGGVQKGQFTTNQSGDTTINIAQSDPYVIRGGTYNDFVNARTSIDLSALHTALKIGRGARLMLADMYKYSYYDAISYTATNTDTQSNEDVVKFRYSDTQMLVMTISGIKEPTQTYSVAVETVSIPLANGTGDNTTRAMTQKATTEMVYPNIGKAGIGIGVSPTVAGYGTAIGTYSKANEFNVALGAYATANTDSVNYSMALGYDSKVTRTGEVNIGSTGATMTGYHGYNNTNYRVLGGVHDAVDDHDAVNKSQLDTALATKANTSSLATVATSGSYADLSNKPAIPTVGNGTITVNQGGVQKGQFTTNQSGDTTINIAQSDPYVIRGGTYNDFVNARTSIDLSALHTALKIGRGARLMLADMYKYSYYDAISYTATNTDTQSNEDVVKFRYSDTQMLVMTISGIKEPTQTYSVAVETVSIPLANGTGTSTTLPMTQKAVTDALATKADIASAGAQAMQLTQAQYDALSTAEKNNGTIYFITD